MIADPPFHDGVDHDTATVPFPASTDTTSGAFGVIAMLHLRARYSRTLRASAEVNVREKTSTSRYRPSP